MRKHLGGWLIVLLMTGSAHAGLVSAGASKIVTNPVVQPSSQNLAAGGPVAEVDEPPGLLLVLLGTGILILWMRRWPPKR